MKEEQLIIYDRQSLDENRAWKIALLSQLLEYYFLHQVRAAQHRAMETNKELPFEAWELIAEYFSQMYNKHITAGQLIGTADEFVDKIIKTTEEIDEVEKTLTQNLGIEKRFLQFFIEKVNSTDHPFLNLNGREMSLTHIYSTLALYLLGKRTKDECEHEMQFFKALNPAVEIDNILLRSVFWQSLELFWQLYDEMYPFDEYPRVSEQGRLNISIRDKTSITD